MSCCWIIFLLLLCRNNTRCRTAGCCCECSNNCCNGCCCEADCDCDSGVIVDECIVTAVPSESSCGYVPYVSTVAVDNTCNSQDSNYNC